MHDKFDLVNLLLIENETDYIFTLVLSIYKCGQITVNSPLARPLKSWMSHIYDKCFMNYSTNDDGSKNPTSGTQVLTGFMFPMRIVFHLFRFKTILKVQINVSIITEQFLLLFASCGILCSVIQ